MQKGGDLVNFRTFIIVVLVVLILGVTNLNLQMRYSHNIGVKEYEVLDLSQCNIPENLAETVNKQELKIKIQKLFNEPHSYKEIESEQLGETFTNAFLRKVAIKKDLDNEWYVITYTHELCHIKYWTQNDTYVSYKTFVILYESGDYIFKNVAERDAYRVLSGYWKGTDYDAGYYIQNYLRERNIIL